MHRLWLWWNEWINGYNFLVCASGFVTNNSSNSRGDGYDLQGPGADSKMRHSPLATLFYCLCITWIRCLGGYLCALAGLYLLKIISKNIYVTGIFSHNVNLWGYRV